MADEGYCDREATVYVYGRFGRHADAEGRVTIVAGPRGRWLAEHQPDGARCIDHALDEVEALTVACRPLAGAA
jgi:hypothetical protein